jgi:hypothetical protein
LATSTTPSFSFFYLLNVLRPSDLPSQVPLRFAARSLNNFRFHLRLAATTHRECLDRLSVLARDTHARSVARF